MSTNKVYGDAPHELPLEELETRWDYADESDYAGIGESCRIDQTMHSLFGASKAAADILAQEYGKYFELKTGIFRGGCLTGAGHRGVELHGFLSYLVHVAVVGKPYTIFGYKDKQVRDQIECSDVVKAFEAFAKNPRPGEVDNIGGAVRTPPACWSASQKPKQFRGMKSSGPSARRTTKAITSVASTTSAGGDADTQSGTFAFHSMRFLAR